MYGRLYRRNSIEFKERTEQDAGVMLELELKRLRESGKLGQTADNIVKAAFGRFQELFCTYLEQEGPDHDIDIELPKIQPLPQVRPLHSMLGRLIYECTSMEVQQDFTTEMQIFYMLFER